MQFIKLAVAASACAAIALGAAPASAQSAPQATILPAAGNVLRAGTEINMVTRTELTSRSARVGERFELEVSEDVSLNGQTVIPTGSVAVGEVTRVRRKGMWGRSGRLETRLLYVRVGDQQIRISGAAGDRGRTGTAGVVASVALLPIAGFFVTGTSAVLPPRSPTVGYLDSDLPVVFAAPAAPQALVVPAAPPAAATQPAPPAQEQPN